MKDDHLIIQNAFQRIRYLEMMYGDDIPWRAIEKGFEFNGEVVLLANKARGIFKPRQLSRGLISIKTTMPRQGRVNIYHDEAPDPGFFRYSLQRGNPRMGGNKNLWEAFEDRMPFIYFFPVAPSVYKAIWPCFVSEIHPQKSFCEIIVGNSLPSSIVVDIPVQYEIPQLLERKYRIAESRIRIHQAAFREQVLDAYGQKCAITQLPVPSLLEAAHIIPDGDPAGDALVNNGIALSRIHHKAFDANLIGIDPDYQIHISERLLSLNDGPLLESGLKAYQGKFLILPDNKNYYPDPARLEKRFSQYLIEQ